MYPIHVTTQSIKCEQLARRLERERERERGPARRIYDLARAIAGREAENGRVRLVEDEEVARDGVGGERGEASRRERDERGVNGDSPC